MTLVATSALYMVVFLRHGREVPYIGDDSAEKWERQGVTFGLLSFIFYLLSKYLKDYVLSFQTVELLYRRLYIHRTV